MLKRLKGIVLENKIKWQNNKTIIDFFELQLPTT